MSENNMKITPDEMIESLTGFDEIAIAKAFGSEWGELAEKGSTTFMRALVFIQKRRDGMNDPDAKNAALAMTLKDTQDAFDVDEDEVMPEEPVTEPGKDESTDETPHMDSLPSAS